MAVDPKVGTKVDVLLPTACLHDLRRGPGKSDGRSFHTLLSALSTGNKQVMVDPAGKWCQSRYP